MKRSCEFPTHFGIFGRLICCQRGCPNCHQSLCRSTANRCSQQLWQTSWSLGRLLWQVTPPRLHFYLCRSVLKITSTIYCHCESCQVRTASQGTLSAVWRRIKQYTDSALEIIRMTSKNLVPNVFANTKKKTANRSSPGFHSRVKATFL